LIPNEIAIAIPNNASNTALPNATHRGHTPNINATPKNNSAAVAAHARYGIEYAGMNEFTFAV
jgi:hypothetical protein